MMTLPLFSLKLSSAVVIFLFAVFSAYLPFKKRLKSSAGYEFPCGEAFASGVFLGAALIHMLGDAASHFAEQGVAYPYAFLLCGLVFLLLLFFEHVSGEVQHHGKIDSLVVLTLIILCVHSFLEGAALGLGDTFVATVVILSAIVAHKWAASFSLAVQINRSSFNFLWRLGLFLLFAIMTPLGIIAGEMIHWHASTWMAPVFEALAAGTFLYIGTLHGLPRAMLQRQCCNLWQYGFVILGFLLMALIAVWV